MHYAINNFCYILMNNRNILTYAERERERARAREAGCGCSSSRPDSIGAEQAGMSAIIEGLGGG